MEEQKVDAWGKLVSLVQELPDIELIGEEMVTFGSSDKCTYVIKNQSISKFHCSFQLKKGQNSSAKIKDYSIHGTFVNGKRIGKGFSRPLFHTDEISFASIRDKSKPRPVACYILKLFSVLPREKSDESEIKKIYKIGRLLGTGKFAEVRMATDKQGKRYAMKIVDKQKFQEGETDDQQAQRDPAMDEMNILTKISHENIVGIHQVFNTENHIYLVLDLCTGGELLDKITAKGFYKENDAIVVMKQLFSALAYLHKMQFAHRDLKPENIMLVNSKDDTSIKICDFGLSRFTSEKEKMSTFVGTLQYLAPEIIVQLYPESIAKGYTKACDLWSCGIILYVLLSGYIPFTSLKQTMIMKQILEGDIDFPPDIFSNVSIAARNLIRRMLTVDPLHRITAEEALQHPWILGQSEKIKDEMQDVWTKKPKLFK